MNPLNQKIIPIFHSNTCNLTGNTVTKEFRTVAVNYCPECFAYAYDYDFCEHDLIPVKFKLDNGAYQVRNYCKKCFKLTPQPLKHSDFDLSKLPEKSLSTYRAFYDDRYMTEKQDIDKLVESLRVKAHEFEQNVYTTYLKSPVWTETRTKILIRDNHTCQICGEPAEAVHHLTYVNRGREFPFELVSLCHKCHITTYHPERYEELIITKS